MKNSLDQIDTLNNLYRAFERKLQKGMIIFLSEKERSLSVKENINLWNQANVLSLEERLLRPTKKQAEEA